MRTEWVTVRTVWGRNREEVRWILFLRYFGSIWLSGGVFSVPVSENRQYRGLWFSSGKQSSHGVKEGSCWLVRRAVSDKKISGQERVRRSNIRLPGFLDRVCVESQYKGYPVHTPGDLLRFLQVGPDDRTKTLESRESCSLLSWFAAKFRKKQKIVFRRLPKRSCSKWQILPTILRTFNWEMFRNERGACGSRCSSISVSGKEKREDGSDVTIVALKLAMNSHFPLPKIRNWRWAYTFPCQKFALLVSAFTLPVSPFTERLPLWRWNSQWVHTFHCQNFFRRLCSPSFIWHEPCDEWSKTQENWSNPTQSYFVLSIEKMNQINTKNYWK